MKTLLNTMPKQPQADLKDLFGDSSSSEDELPAPRDDAHPDRPDEPQESLLDDTELLQDRPLPADQMDNVPSAPARSVKIPLIDPLDPSEQLFHVKLPQFLHIEPTPFDPESFSSEAPAESGRHAENTVRWMYDRIGGRKKSNSRVIRYPSFVFFY